MSRRRRRFRQEILMAGNHWADRTGVLCRSGCETRALPALGARLSALPWERLHLDGLSGDATRHELLLDAFGGKGFRIDEQEPRDNDGATRLDRAPRLALPGTFDAWLDERLGSGTRQRVRRFRRRLANDPRRRIRGSGERTLSEDLATFRRLWLARWAAAKGERAEVMADKYVRILSDGLAAGQLSLRVLEEDGRAVAIHALYDDPPTATVSFFAGARDETFDALPAGLLLHADAIERAIADGRRVYDLLRGDEPYKYRLGAEDASIVTLLVRRTPPRVEDVLLEPCWQDEALAAIGRIECSASVPTVGRLYSQLIESWPAEPRVLDRFEAWLGRQEREDASPDP